MNQLIAAREGKLTPEVERVSLNEEVEVSFLQKEIAQGHIIILHNQKHSQVKPVGIGKGLLTKVNANIGTSQDAPHLKDELQKLKVAIEAGTDTVMDLSTAGPLDEIRRAILQESTVPVGTVPIYQAVCETCQKGRPIGELSAKEIFKLIEGQAEDGVDFITVHCGLTQASLQRLKKGGRILDVVSRGGVFILEWMVYNQKENLFFEHFDELLEIAKAFDLTLSLGDGLRPGCIADATDSAQIQELIILGELCQQAWDEGVQVMIEGPGHIPLDQIEANVLLEKRLCHGAPFYVLGPVVTDLAPGYDHITSAIGGSIAAWKGADFLCYVTPSEHLRLPNIEEVREGVIAARIAAHAGDIAKGHKRSLERDMEMAQMRRKLDWKGQIDLALDTTKARELRESSSPQEKEVCTMCGQFCAIKAARKLARHFS